MKDFVAQWWLNQQGLVPIKATEELQAWVIKQFLREQMNETLTQ